MPLSKEQLFIRQLKQAYVKALLEIGDKNKMIRDLEKKIDQLKSAINAANEKYEPKVQGGLPMQSLRVGEGDMPSDRQEEEALQRHPEEGTGGVRGDESSQDPSDGEKVRLSV